MRKYLQPNNFSSHQTPSFLLGIITLALILFLSLFVNDLGFGYSIIFSIIIVLLLHFLIYSNSINPILVCILLLPLLMPVFYISQKFGAVFFLFILAMSLTICLRERLFVRFIGPVFFASSVSMYALLHSPIVGTDEAMFFAQLQRYSNITDYLHHIYLIGTEDLVNLRSSRQMLPLFYLPLYFSLGLSDPVIIIIVNSTLWVLTCLMFRELIISHTDSSKSIFLSNTVFVLMLVSPSAVYWTSAFAKDIVSVFLCTLAVYLYFRHRFFLFLIILGVATAIRAYSIAIVAIYIAVFMQSLVLLGIGSIGSILFIVVYTGTPISFVNATIIFNYFFISPNPLNIANWTTPTLLLRTVEGIILYCMFIIGILYSLTDQYNQKEYFILLLGIGIYALVMTAVGYDVLMSRGLSYGIGTLGDNILRKKLPILPLVFLWISYTVYIQKQYIRELKFKL